MTNEYFTLPEVAKIAKLNYHTIRDWVSREYIDIAAPAMTSGRTNQCDFFDVCRFLLFDRLLRRGISRKQARNAMKVYVGRPDENDLNAKAMSHFVIYFDGEMPSNEIAIDHDNGKMQITIDSDSGACMVVNFRAIVREAATLIERYKFQEGK